MQMNITLKHKHNYLLQTTTKATINSIQLQLVIVPSEKACELFSTRQNPIETVYVRQNT